MKKTLNDLREEIDKLDASLIKGFSKRTSLVSEIGRIKKINNIEMLDEKRKSEVLNKWKKIAKKEKVSGDFIESIYKLLHDYSLEAEQKY